MRGWSTAILGLVLAGLVGYIYFVDAERDPSGFEAKEKVFGTVDADDIDELQVRNADGETSRLQKTDGTWQLVEPVQGPADESEASSIASSLSSLEIQRVVEENATDLAQYGLEMPRLEVAFRAKGDTELRRLFVGEKTPTGTDLYARGGESGRVILVSSSVDSTFNKSTFTLRDRRILVFERNEVDGLEVTGRTGSVRLAKSGSEWRLAAPLSARADYAAVEGALGRLASTQMQGIVDQGGQDLAKYGLAKPVSTITVTSGSASATLQLGGTDNALQFARDASRPLVFTVAPALSGDVIRSAADFRRKDLFDSRSFNAARVELTRGAQTMTLEKTKGKDEADVWQLDGKDVDSATVEDLLSKLTGLRAESFDSQAPAALKTPALVAAVTFDDKKQETVTFGRSGADVVASRSDEPGSAKVAADAFDEALKALDAVK